MARRFPTNALWFTLAIASVFGAGRAEGDLFLLHSGGRIQGEWTNRSERKPSGSEVTTSSGILVRLAKESISLRVPELKIEEEYERIAPLHANTIESQWKLAEWCRENNLAHRRQGHLEAILALDTDHVPARRALGYQNYRGQWQQREEQKRREGYAMYRGRWRLIPDIDLQEERAARHDAETEWLKKLRIWRRELTSERPWEAMQRFESLQDPLAVSALRSLMQEETNRRVKIIYLDALERIGEGGAVQIMITTALNDQDEEIFYEAADRLKKLPPHVMEKSLLEALRDSSPKRINRAAYLLGKMGNERLVSPLIDALVTVQRQVVTGNDTNSFGSNGSAGIGRGGPTYIDYPVQNRFVLTALVEITGQNFDFDQRAWRRWYNIEKSRIFADGNVTGLRRENSPDLVPEQ